LIAPWGGERKRHYRSLDSRMTFAFPPKGGIKKISIHRPHAHLNEDCTFFLVTSHATKKSISEVLVFSPKKVGCTLYMLRSCDITMKYLIVYKMYKYSEVIAFAPENTVRTLRIKSPKYKVFQKNKNPKNINTFNMIKRSYFYRISLSISHGVSTKETFKRLSTVFPSRRWFWSIPWNGEFRSGNVWDGSLASIFTT